MKKWVTQSGQKVTAGIAVTLGVGSLIALALTVWFLGFEAAPVVVGKSVQEAEVALRDAGISFDAHGAQGTVIDQDPIGGERWFRYKDFVLTYTNDTGTHVIGGPDADE